MFSFTFITFSHFSHFLSFFSIKISIFIFIYLHYHHQVIRHSLFIEHLSLVSNGISNLETHPTSRENQKKIRSRLLACVYERLYFRVIGDWSQAFAFVHTSTPRCVRQSIIKCQKTLPLPYNIQWISIITTHFLVD